MINTKRLIPVLLIAVLLVFALAAFSNGEKESSRLISEQLLSSSSEMDLDTCYELDTNRSLAVAVVKEVAEGPSRRGYVTLAARGVLCQHIKCDVLCFYNEARLKSICRADGADCRYNQYTVQESRGELVMDDAFYKMAQASNDPIVYNIYIDWDYKDIVKAGDTMLIDLGTILNQNPNGGVREPSQHHLVVEPFGVEHKAPFLAKFVDGKLQLPDELKDSLNLRRLYDDTEPERTEIKDGDSVEDVIAFIKCVEQDVERFQESIMGR